MSISPSSPFHPPSSPENLDDFTLIDRPPPSAEETPSAPRTPETWEGGFLLGGAMYYGNSISNLARHAGVEFNRLESYGGGAAAGAVYNLGPWLMYNYSGASLASMTLFGIPTLPAWVPVLAGLGVAGGLYATRQGVNAAYSAYNNRQNQDAQAPTAEEVRIALEKAKVDLTAAETLLRKLEEEYIHGHERLTSLETLVRNHRSQPLEVQKAHEALIELREKELKALKESQEAKATTYTEALELYEALFLAITDIEK